MTRKGKRPGPELPPGLDDAPAAPDAVAGATPRAEPPTHPREFARLHLDLQATDPQEFLRKEHAIQRLYAQRHPKEDLLRVESRDRSVVFYLRPET